MVAPGANLTLSPDITKSIALVVWKNTPHWPFNPYDLGDGDYYEVRNHKLAHVRWNGTDLLPQTAGKDVPTNNVTGAELVKMVC